MVHCKKEKIRFCKEFVEWGGGTGWGVITEISGRIIFAPPIWERAKNPPIDKEASFVKYYRSKSGLTGRGIVIFPEVMYRKVLCLRWHSSIFERVIYIPPPYILEGEVVGWQDSFEDGLMFSTEQKKEVKSVKIKTPYGDLYYINKTVDSGAVTGYYTYSEDGKKWLFTRKGEVFLVK